MLFNSFEFAIYFPIVTVLYFVLPHRWRCAWLLAASAFFYASFVPAYLLILVGLIAVDYVAGLLIDQAKSTATRRSWLVASLIANVGVLSFFKYFNFVNENLNQLFAFVGWHYLVSNLKVILPIGLSFHTFQSMSYTIEVYKRRQKAERNLGIYALYVLFYPQLVAGPIERPQNLLHQLRAIHHPRYDRITRGLKRMFIGFFKKMVIADGLAVTVNAVYDSPRSATSLDLLLATYFFAIQIFCDFSGYSDIALGCAEILGIDLMVNFRRPYLAASITDFWRRWHISLSTWFRDYLYIPMGGSRVNSLKRYRNVLIVFLVSGLWHGASWTFVVWGLVHGLTMIATEWLTPAFQRLKVALPAISPLLWRIAGTLLTFHIVVLAWVFFRANSLSDAFFILRHIWPIAHAPAGHQSAIDPTQLYIALVLIAGLFVAQLFEEGEPVWRRLAGKPTWVRWAAYYASVAAFVFFLISQGGAARAQQFIYFQF